MTKQTAQQTQTLLQLAYHIEMADTKRRFSFCLRKRMRRSMSNPLSSSSTTTKSDTDGKDDAPSINGMGRSLRRCRSNPVPSKEKDSVLSKDNDRRTRALSVCEEDVAAAKSFDRMMRMCASSCTNNPAQGAPAPLELKRQSLRVSAVSFQTHASPEIEKGQLPIIVGAVAVEGIGDNNNHHRQSHAGEHFVATATLVEKDNTDDEVQAMKHLVQEKDSQLQQLQQELNALRTSLGSFTAAVAEPIVEASPPPAYHYDKALTPGENFAMEMLLIGGAPAKRSSRRDKPRRSRWRGIFDEQVESRHFSYRTAAKPVEASPFRIF